LNDWDIILGNDGNLHICRRVETELEEEEPAWARFITLWSIDPALGASAYEFHLARRVLALVEATNGKLKPKPAGKDSAAPKPEYQT